MRATNLWGIYPNIIFLIAVVSFMTMYAAPGIAHISEDEKTIATILGIFTIFVSGYLFLLDIIGHLQVDVTFALIFKPKDMYNSIVVTWIVIDTLKGAENNQS